MYVCTFVVASLQIRFKKFPSPTSRKTFKTISPVPFLCVLVILNIRRFLPNYPPQTGLLIDPSVDFCLHVDCVTYERSFIRSRHS